MRVHSFIIPLFANAVFAAPFVPHAVRSADLDSSVTTALDPLETQALEARALTGSDILTKTLPIRDELGGLDGLTNLTKLLPIRNELSELDELTNLTKTLPVRDELGGLSGLTNLTKLLPIRDGLGDLANLTQELGVRGFKLPTNATHGLDAVTDKLHLRDLDRLSEALDRRDELGEVGELTQVLDARQLGELSSLTSVLDARQLGELSSLTSVLDARQLGELSSLTSVLDARQLGELSSLTSVLDARQLGELSSLTSLLSLRDELSQLSDLTQELNAREESTQDLERRQLGELSNVTQLLNVRRQLGELSSLTSLLSLRDALSPSEEVSEAESLTKLVNARDTLNTTEAGLLGSTDAKKLDSSLTSANSNATDLPNLQEAANKVMSVARDGLKSRELNSHTVTDLASAKLIPTRDVSGVSNVTAIVAHEAINAAEGEAENTTLPGNTKVSELTNTADEVGSMLPSRDVLSEVEHLEPTAESAVSSSDVKTRGLLPSLGSLVPSVKGLPVKARDEGIPSGYTSGFEQVAEN